MPTKSKSHSKSRRKTAGKAASRRSGARKAGLLDRLLHHAAINVKNRHSRRRNEQRARRDAAVLRATHSGCTTCNGLGQITIRGKNGEFKGSKTCPATPATLNTSHAITLRAAARFSTDRNVGLWGWTCPCGAKGKPRCRTAKDADRQLTTHNRKEHGGTSLGGTVHQQTAAPPRQAPPAAVAIGQRAKTAKPTTRKPIGATPKAKP